MTTEHWYKKAVLALHPLQIHLHEITKDDHLEYLPKDKVLLTISDPLLARGKVCAMTAEGFFTQQNEDDLTPNSTLESKSEQWHKDYYYTMEQLRYATFMLTDSFPQKEAGQNSFYISTDTLLKAQKVINKIDAFWRKDKRQLQIQAPTP